MAASMSFTSRFAVLKIEDDELDLHDGDNKLMSISKSASETQNLNKKKSKKKKNQLDKDNTNELQNLAFVSNKPKKKQGSFSHKGLLKKEATSEQWEEWIKKDNEFVTDTYEHDLQQAILLSKLDYEEKKDHYDSSKPDDTDSSKSNKNNKKVTKKKEKPSTLSLEEFNNLPPSEIENYTKENKSELCLAKPKPKPVPTGPPEQFFEKIVEDTEKILHREQKEEAIRKNLPYLLQNARSSRFQEELEKKNIEIDELKAEIEKLKDEMLQMKKRSKKLCSILSQGEMRDKTEILIQVEQLTRIKDELTEQVTELHAALEQERSKVHNLQMEVKKFQSVRKESK